MTAKRYWSDNSQLADIKVAKFVDQVFERLAEYHTEEKRNKAVGLVDGDMAKVKASWAREFCLMTPEMVIRGGRKIRDQSFCPNLARFTQLCKPSPEEAFAEAQIGMMARSHGDFGSWTCPAVFSAAIGFGSSDLRDKDWLRASARFTKIYETSIEKQERGELDEIPPPVPADMRIESAPVVTKDVAKAEALVKRAFAAVKPTSQSWAYKPKSFTATREMLFRAKSGVLGQDVLRENLKAGTIEADGDWYKPIGYFERDRLVLV